MMTLDEIKAARINPMVAREAYEHASQRLGDVLSIKDGFEQKASVLFAGYVTIALALFGAGGLAERGAFWGAGVLYIAGACCFAWALRDAAYGVRASDPEMWLTGGIIDGDDKALPAMLAYVTYFHQKRITESQHHNAAKALLIRSGVMLGLIGPIVLLVAFGLPVLLARLGWV